MKRFLITYTYRPETGSAEAWHRSVAEFISAIENDPGLKGRITYRCMKARDGLAYYHLAEAADDEAIKALQQREYFKRYTEETKRVAGGVVEVLPLETIAETKSSPF
jgi:quinol monooxygenase YgiN